MKIYYIIENVWDGMEYSPDNVFCFSSAEKRVAKLSKLMEDKHYKKGDIIYNYGETELDGLE